MLYQFHESNKKYYLGSISTATTERLLRRVDPLRDCKVDGDPVK